jgi:hypothetical protein
MATTKQDMLHNLKRITMENEFISLAVLPDLGGKMISLQNKQSGREFLFRSPRPLNKPVYGQNYADLDASGFDECFPTLAQGFYPEWPWKGTEIPDHGEVFALPWKYEVRQDDLVLSVSGVRFPYTFTKIIQLKENSVTINYELRNHCAYDFKYLWSAHPMLVVQKGMKIHLPGNPRVRTDFSLHERFGKHLYETTWPNAWQADGKQADLSIVRSDDENAATKFFTTALPEGWCGLEDPESGDFLKMEFPVEKVPYVGVWINEGGVFEAGTNYQVALEPCTGCPDKLETAIQRGEYSIVKTQSTNTWYLNIILEVHKSL